MSSGAVVAVVVVSSHVCVSGSVWSCDGSGDGASALLVVLGARGSSRRCRYIPRLCRGDVLKGSYGLRRAGYSVGGRVGGVVSTARNRVDGRHARLEVAQSALSTLRHETLVSWGGTLDPEHNTTDQ